MIAPQFSSSCSSQQLSSTYSRLISLAPRLFYPPQSPKPFRDCLSISLVSRLAMHFHLFTTRTLMLSLLLRNSGGLRVSHLRMRPYFRKIQGISSITTSSSASSSTQPPTPPTLDVPDDLLPFLWGQGDWSGWTNRFCGDTGEVVPVPTHLLPDEVSSPSHCHVCVCVCIYMYVCIYVCIYVCMLRGVETKHER